MSRGRKPKTVLFDSEWEQIFEKSQGFYFQYIIIQLGRKNKNLSKENAIDLLEIINKEKEKLIAEKKLRKEKSLPEIRANELPFEIPSNWNWCRLGEIVQHNSGKTKDSGRNKGELREYITTSNLYWGYFDLDNVKSMPFQEKDLERCVAEKGDLLVCEGGEAGRAAVWESESNIRFQNHIHRLRPYCNVNAYYLYHFFQLLNFTGEINNYRKGMGISNLSGKSLSSIKIPLPPLNEQKIISEFLQDFGKNAIDENREYFDSEMEDKIVSFHQAQIYNNQILTELSHQLELISRLRQAFLREAMQGKLVPQDERDEPAVVLLEKIKAEKEKLIAEKKIKNQKPLPEIKPEEIPFEIPNNWTWCRLGDCSINRDGERIPISLPERERRKKIYDYYGASGVIDKIDNFTHEGRFLLIGEDGANLVARSTPIAFIVEGKFWVNNHAHVIETIDEISTDYLCNYINGISLSSYITGGFQPKLSQSNLNIIVTPLPPLAEQKRIVEKLEKLMKFCDELEANIRESANRAETLLQVALKEALEPK